MSEQNRDADATRGKLAHRGIQPADVADAVAWVREVVETPCEAGDDIANSDASIKP